MRVPEGSGRRKAARLVWEARRRAGLSRSDLAESAGLPPRTLRRIEAGEVVPRLDTVERLLLGCGRTLSTEFRPVPAHAKGAGTAPRLVTALWHLRGAYLEHILAGDFAAFMHGVAVHVSDVDILIPDTIDQRGRLQRAIRRLDRPYSRVVIRAGSLAEEHFGALRRASAELGPVPTPVASIDDLIELETDEGRRERLRALREAHDRDA